MVVTIIITTDIGDKMEIDVSDNNFKKEVIERSEDMPVLVDFWATWCMPCQIFKPILEKVAKDYDDKFALAKVNVDSAPESSSKYGVMSIPSVKLFKNGKIAEEFVGSLSEPKLREWLDENL